MCTISDGRIRSPELRRPRRPSTIAFPPFSRAKGKESNQERKKKQGPSRWLAAEEQSLPASPLVVDWSRFNEAVTRASLGLNRSGEMHRKKKQNKKPLARPPRAGGRQRTLLTYPNRSYRSVPDKAQRIATSVRGSCARKAQAENGPAVHLLRVPLISSHPLPFLLPL